MSYRTTYIKIHLQSFKRKVIHNVCSIMSDEQYYFSDESYQFSDMLPRLHTEQTNLKVKHLTAYISQ